MARLDLPMKCCERGVVSCVPEAVWVHPSSFCVLELNTLHTGEEQEAHSPLRFGETETNQDQQYSYMFPPRANNKRSWKRSKDRIGGSSLSRVAPWTRQVGLKAKLLTCVGAGAATQTHAAMWEHIHFDPAVEVLMELRARGARLLSCQDEKDWCFGYRALNHVCGGAHALWGGAMAGAKWGSKGPSGELSSTSNGSRIELLVADVEGTRGMEKEPRGGRELSILQRAMAQATVLLGYGHMLARLGNANPNLKHLVDSEELETWAIAVAQEAYNLAWRGIQSGLLRHADVQHVEDVEDARHAGFRHADVGYGRGSKADSAAVLMSLESRLRHVYQILRNIAQLSKPSIRSKRMGGMFRSNTFQHCRLSHLYEAIALSKVGSALCLTCLFFTSPRWPTDGSRLASKIWETRLLKAESEPLVRLGAE
ncbi:unnamed protein product, partial [Discosporangium mesarthrocarpum]